MNKTFQLLCVYSGLILLLLTADASKADVITFEGVVPPGEFAIPVAPYTEGNYILTAVDDDNGIFSVTSFPNSAGFTSDFFAWNNLMAPPEITLARLPEFGGAPFNFVSIEIGTFFDEDPTDITFTGNKLEGGTVSQSYFGVTSATVVSPVGFTNLTSLEISASNHDAAIDNITVNTIPEPSTLILLALAGGIGFARRRKTV